MATKLENNFTQRYSERPETESREKLEDLNVEQVTYVELSAKEAAEVMKRVSIHGGTFEVEEGRAELLTTQFLVEKNLAPLHKISLGGGRFWYASQPYAVSGGRKAVVGYMENGSGGLVARTFYHSNSSGVWRYLPSYLSGAPGKIQWYSKGHGEESVSLPVIMQMAMANLTENVEPVNLGKDANFVFAGTARDLVESSVKGTYMLEVKEKPIELGEQFHSDHGSKSLLPPEQLKFNGSVLAPVFGQPEISWKQKSNQYGVVHVDVFRSKDQTIRYMFCHDDSGRGWFGGGEPAGEVQSTGLKHKWVDPGNLGVPAWEYVQQSGGYGSGLDKSGKYMDMFPNYLSKVECIQDYLEWVKKPDPLATEIHTVPEAAPESVVPGSEYFAHVANLEDLVNMIKALGVILGTRQDYTSDQLIEKIYLVVKGRESVNAIPRTHGLRSALTRILNQNLSAVRTREQQAVTAVDLSFEKLYAFVRGKGGFMLGSRYCTAEQAVRYIQKVRNGEWEVTTLPEYFQGIVRELMRKENPE